MLLDKYAAPTKPNRIIESSNKSEAPIHKPVLKVLGLGGGGSNAVDRMLELGIEGVEFIIANTDRQALEQSYAQHKIQLGPKLTRGLGAGGDPQVGQAAAQESWKEIEKALAGADMVFLTAGMGGGTGTGSIPIAAKIARSQGAVTIAIVTTPFSFEMGARQKNAANGLALLRKNTDTLIAIPNDRLLYVAPKDLPLDTAFRLADDVLRQAVQAITELITIPGLINVDFAHIRRLMQLGGGALMAIGNGEGENKALSAVKQALNHPLLESISIDRAAGIIASFNAGDDLALSDVSDALNYLQEQTYPETEIILGATQKPEQNGQVQVILVVTGIGAPSLEDILPGSERYAVQNDSLVKRNIFDNLPTREQPSTIDKANLDLPAFLRRR